MQPGNLTALQPITLLSCPPGKDSEDIHKHTIKHVLHEKCDIMAYI